MKIDDHISDAELVALLDAEFGGERASGVLSHFDACEQCRQRRWELEDAHSAYARFHSQVLQPALATRQWPVLELEPKRKVGAPLWVYVAVACMGVVLGVFLAQRHSQSDRMVQLLDKAQNAPARASGRIELRANGVSWIREIHSNQESIAPHWAKVRELFVNAHYSWGDPLSARSFAAWRQTLRHKRDHVSTIELDSGGAAYLVRTETAESSMRSASLTLLRDSLEPIQGDFRFDGNQDVMIREAGQTPVPPVPHARSRETSVAPSEELRVLTALNEIGADVSDSITVRVDSTQSAIVVTGLGVAPSRQVEIRSKLRAFPKAIVRFLSHLPHELGSTSAAIPAEAADPRTHSLLETRAGGAQQFEQLSSAANDAGDALLAHAHALNELATQFPPRIAKHLSPDDTSILSDLRRRHAAAIEQSARNLETVLHTLLPQHGNESATEPGTDASWQAAAGKLYERAGALDNEIARLLSSAYEPQRSEAVLEHLPNELDKLRELAQAQTSTP